MTFEPAAGQTSGERVGPRQLRRLLDVAVLITSDLELDAVLRRVIESAVALVDARYGALGVLNEAGDELVEFITVGIDDEERARIGALPKGLGLLGSLIRNASPLRLADLHEHPDSVGFPPSHPEMTSFLGVPIQVRGQVFGNLYLTDKTTGDEVFTDIDEELAAGLASVAAVAIDNARLFGQIRRREATLAAMGEIAAALLAGVEQVEALRLIAHHARELVGADLATVALPEPDGETLAIDVADGPLSAGLVGLRFPMAGSASGEVLASGEAVVTDDASLDHRTNQPQVSSQRIGPAVWVPLRLEGATFGSLSVARGLGAPPFRRDELELVASFALQASVVLEHDRARAGLQRVALLEEGERIARDLHDSVIQRVFAAAMYLQATHRRTGDAAVRDRIVKVVGDLDDTIQEIRTVIFGLEQARFPARPADLRSGALEVVRDESAALGFEPALAFVGALELAPEPVATDLLATLREALSNIARHAAAGSARVEVSSADHVLRLRVSDDGVGIGDTTGGGHGLNNMRSRAERHGGWLAVVPGPDGGTVLTWEVPLSE